MVTVMLSSEERVVEEACEISEKPKIRLRRVRSFRSTFHLAIIDIIIALDVFASKTIWIQTSQPTRTRTIETRAINGSLGLTRIQIRPSRSRFIKFKTCT